MKHLSLFLSALIMWSFTACGPSSQITSSWVKPQANISSLDRIMVLALVGDNNRELRQQMETALVKELHAAGYNALSSYTEYGPSMFDARDEETAIRQLQDKNADAILTVVMLDKNRERYYVPGRVQYTPYAVYYNRFWGYYTTLYDRTYLPGYYTTNTEYFWESNLYNLSTRELLYSVQTRSFNPGSASDLADEYSKLIVDNMLSEKVLSKR